MILKRLKKIAALALAAAMALSLAACGSALSLIHISEPTRRS